MTEIIFDLDQRELSFTASEGSVVRRTILDSGVRVLTETMPAAASASDSESEITVRVNHADNSSTSESLQC